MKSDFNDKPELYYDFEDPDAPGKDSSAKSNDALLSGNYSVVDGRGGKVLRLDSRFHGTDDAYIEIPAGVFRHREITFSAWVRYDVNTVGSWARVFAVACGKRRAPYSRIHC